MSSTDTYLTRKELAARWRVTEAYLRNMAYQKRGPAVTKIGGNARYRLDRVLEFEDQSTAA